MMKWRYVEDDRYVTKTNEGGNEAKNGEGNSVNRHDTHMLMAQRERDNIWPSAKNIVTATR